MSSFLIFECPHHAPLPYLLNSYRNTPKKDYIAVIAHILNRTEDTIWINVLQKVQANWGWGPTIHTTLAALKDGSIYPNLMPSEEEKFKKLIASDYDNDRVNPYRLIDPPECCICLERPANQWCCTKPHLSGCEECVKKIDKCPLCREPIIRRTTVTFTL